MTLGFHIVCQNYEQHNWPHLPSGLNTFPCGREFDEYALFTDTRFLVERDEPLSTRHHLVFIKR